MGEGLTRRERDETIAPVGAAVGGTTRSSVVVTSTLASVCSSVRRSAGEGTEGSAKVLREQKRMARSG